MHPAAHGTAFLHAAKASSGRHTRLSSGCRRLPPACPPALEPRLDGRPRWRRLQPILLSPRVLARRAAALAAVLGDAQQLRLLALDPFELRSDVGQQLHGGWGGVGSWWVGAVVGWVGLGWVDWGGRPPVSNGPQQSGVSASTQARRVEGLRQTEAQPWRICLLPTSGRQLATQSGGRGGRRASGAHRRCGFAGKRGGGGAAPGWGRRWPTTRARCPPPSAAV